MAPLVQSAADDEINLLEIVAITLGLLMLSSALFLAATSRAPVIAGIPPVASSAAPGLPAPGPLQL